MVEIQTTEYLAQLLKDKKQLAAFPNVFNHLERLLDEGKSNIYNSTALSFKFHYDKRLIFKNNFFQF